VARWNAEVGKVLASSDVRERFVHEGQEPSGGSSDEFGQFIRAETDKYAKVIKAAGVPQQ
jgi:tripartite-type tricarboxylate transporter receptor subunit TctC